MKHILNILENISVTLVFCKGESKWRNLLSLSGKWVQPTADRNYVKPKKNPIFHEDRCPLHCELPTRQLERLLIDDPLYLSLFDFVLWKRVKPKMYAVQLASSEYWQNRIIYKCKQITINIFFTMSEKILL